MTEDRNQMTDDGRPKEKGWIVKKIGVDRK